MGSKQAAYIPLAEPQFKGNEWKYVKECLDSGWVSSAGPFIKRFENEFAAFVGAPYAVAAASGTAALHTALLAVGVRPGNAVRYCGAFPVFMDVDAKTWHMDVEKTERFLNEECESRKGECTNKKSEIGRAS